MSTRVMRTLGAWLASTLMGGLTACAGAETPTVSSELADDVAAAYAGAAPAAGAAGSGGASSREPRLASGDDEDAAGAQGGAAAGNAPTSDNAAPPASAAAGGAAAAGDRTNSAGAAGSQVQRGGSGSVQETCDGFAILATNCGSSGCHGDGSNLEDFAASEDAARAFIDRPGTLACVGQGNVIDADDPGASLMLTKVSDDPPCGQRMPAAGAPLSDADIGCLEEWIGSL